MLLMDFVDTMTQSALLQSNNDALQPVRNLVGKGELKRAFQLVKHARDDRAVNTQSVLLIRMGDPNSAIRILQSRVWDLPTATLKTDANRLIQLNFATAMLKCGRVPGCEIILRSISDCSDEFAQELISHISNWEASLSWWNRMDWKLFGIPHIPSPSPFERLAGRFDWEVAGVTRRDANGFDQIQSVGSLKLAS